GEGLLDTYNDERQPVGALTTEQAYTRYVLRVDPSLGMEDAMPVVHELPVELGYRYRSGAVTPIDDDEAMWEDTREPSGRPGFRAPHVWLDEQRSTLDLFGRDFVVVAGPQGDAWRTSAERAAASLGVAVPVHTVEAEVAALYGIGDEGAALVRPDGFVAWRTS